MKTKQVIRGELLELSLFFFDGGQSICFNLCQQAEKNSVLLFMLASLGWNMKKYFSVKQRQHIFVTGLKAGV